MSVKTCIIWRRVQGSNLLELTLTSFQDSRITVLPTLLQAIISKIDLCGYIVQSLHIDKVNILFYNSIMTQLVSIKDTRDRLAEIIDLVALKDDVFVVTKFGKPKAMIVPIKEGTKDLSWIEAGSGAWSNRKDIKNSAEWARNMRVKMSTRQ